MPDIKKMFEICSFVIKNNAKISDVCEEFEISRKTAQMYTGKYLKDYIASTDDTLAKDLLSEIETIKNNNEKDSQIQKLDVDLNEVINYIIEAKTTIEKAALMFGISESTIHKYISYIKENNNELYLKLKKIQEEVTKRGNALGGKNSVRGPKYTDFESTEIAETMLEENLTLKQASKQFNVPKSSIYERVKSLDDEEMQDDLDTMFSNRRISK